MDERMAGNLFMNSESIGSYVSIMLPYGKDKEEEVQLHYLETGIGEPLLLIHGIGQSLYTWRYIIPELSENYRVIAIDLPGHGYSSRPEHFNYSMDGMVEILHSFLVALEIECAHMIGFSTGSVYMMHYLNVYPEEVANCIAISPGGITKTMPARIRHFKHRLLSVFSRNLYNASNVRKWLSESVTDQSVVDDKMVCEYYEPISDGLSRENLMYAVQNFDMKGVMEQLTNENHEILLLWGSDDKWHNPNRSVYFENVLKNGRYFMINNAGHIIQEDRPKKLLEIILNYIPSVVSEDEKSAFHHFYENESPKNESIPEFSDDAEENDSECYSDDYETDYEYDDEIEKKAEEDSVPSEEEDTALSSEDEDEGNDSDVLKILSEEQSDNDAEEENPPEEDE